MGLSLLPSSRTDRRRVRTRAALIEAARTVFGECGFEGATIQAITDVADVAKGSFYNHFESREALHRAVVETTLAELGAALDRDVERREDDPARVIATSMLSTLRTCLDDPMLGGFLLKNANFLEAESAIGMRGRRDLSRGIEAGRFVIDDIETCMAVLAGAGQGVLSRRLQGELGPSSEPRFIAFALRMLGLPMHEADAIANETTGALERRDR